MVNCARPSSGLRSITNPSDTPLNCTAGPIAVDTIDGAPIVSMRSDPARARLSRRQVVTTRAGDWASASTARASAAILMSLRGIDGADQGAHVPDIGLDGNAHQLRIR